MGTFKRKTSKAGEPVTRSRYWSYKFEWNKKQILRATIFTDRDEARHAMRNHQLALERGRYDIADTLRKRSANSQTTIKELLEAFTDPHAPIESKLRSRLACANALRNALRRVHGQTADIEVLSASAVSSTFVEKYFADATLRANGAGDQARAASIKRTAASVLRQAFSVFSPAAQRHYRRLGLNLPDIEAARRAVKECRFTRVPRHEFVAAPESVIDAMLTAWEKLEDRDIFLAVGHALSYGLRKGEIGQAKWGWHVQQNGQPFLSASAAGGNLDKPPQFKDFSGRLTIRALDPFYTTLMKRVAERGWRGADSDYIITGTDYYRTWQIFNVVAAWMRGLGWKTQKAIHALRDYAGSQVALMDDIWGASGWLRHKNVTVTQASYTSYVSQYSRSNRERLKVKWAGAKPTDAADCGMLNR
jgi:hypothetical protein